MNKLAAGYATRTLAPPLPFPLAGTVTLQERLAGWRRDPLQVVCLALKQGVESALVISLDLLIVDSLLFEDVNTIATGLGFSGAYVHATHTHSSFGGFIDSRGGKYFLGRYRPAVRELLIRQIGAAAAAAASDLKPVSKIRFGSADVPGLTMNRRKKNGPRDDRVQAVEIRRRGGRPVLLVGASGHPVIVMVGAADAVSADYPGEVRRRLTSQGFAPMVLMGALGGLNILFPEMDTPLDDHMDLVGGLVTDGVDRALRGAAESTRANLRYRARKLHFRLTFPPLLGGPAGLALKAAAVAAFGYGYARTTTPLSMDVPTVVVDIGPTALAGMPADFGVGATVLLRDRLTAAGCPVPLVTSHTNGYVGYLHLEQEHRWSPGMRPWFPLYENAMNWYGLDSADRLMSAARELYSGS